MGLAHPSLEPDPGNADACSGTTVGSPVVAVVFIVPVVPVVSVVVPVVCCPHAGNADTKRKVRAANIVRKYGTNLPLLAIYHTYPLTIDYR